MSMSKIKIQIFADEPARYKPWLDETDIVEFHLTPTGALVVKSDRAGLSESVTIGPDRWCAVRIEKPCRSKLAPPIYDLSVKQ